MITVYGIKNCDSVKKALKFFKTRQTDVDFIDFRETPLQREQIASWAEQIPLEKLFNKRSRTYKDLGLSKEQLDKSAMIDWMFKEPLLIKRPVVSFNKHLIVGFNESEYEGVF